jgi:hypothetical protein
MRPGLREHRGLLRCGRPPHRHVDHILRCGANRLNITRFIAPITDLGGSDSASRLCLTLGSIDRMTCALATGYMRTGSRCASGSAMEGCMQGGDVSTRAVDWSGSRFAIDPMSGKPTSLSRWSLDVVARSENEAPKGSFVPGLEPPQTSERRRSSVTSFITSIGECFRNTISGVNGSGVGGRHQSPRPSSFVRRIRHRQSRLIHKSGAAGVGGTPRFLA